MATDATNATDLLSLSEAELDRRLGAALYDDDFGAKDPSEAEQRRRGAGWFEARRDQLQRAVCAQPVVQRYVKNKDAVERELFDAVLSAVAALAGIPVPVGVLAAKIVRYGLSNLCPYDAAAPAPPATA